MNHPALLCLSLLAGLYLGKLWADDLRAWRDGRANPNALPGATFASPKAVGFAVAGGLVLVGLETSGEHWLGVSSQQSVMTWAFAAYSVVAAPVIEETIFRGWLLFPQRGPIVLWAGIAGASLAFAILHPFLWRWDEAGFQLTLGAKGIFSTSVVFATSLWLYYCRIAAWNPHRSLLPCLAGHAAKNLAVVIIKAASGYLGGAW
jgi:membrane protease YdiL (CAAX protease family)